MKRSLSVCGILAIMMLALGTSSTAVGNGKNRSFGWFGGFGHHRPHACPRSPWRLDRNVKTVVSYYTLAFNDGLPRLAVERYVGVDENGEKLYTQHNPFAADGPEAFIAFVEFYKGLFPELNVDIVRTIAQCDLVMTHSQITTGPDDLGNSAMDIFRIDNTGRIVEHWDAVQPVEPNPANDNTMF